MAKAQAQASSLHERRWMQAGCLRYELIATLRCTANIVPNAEGILPEPRL